MVDITKNEEEYKEENYDKFRDYSGYKLEESYLEFLKKYNGGDVSKSIFEYEDDGVMIDFFYGFCSDYYKDFEKEYKYMLDELPEGVLSIGLTVGGDSVCISTNEEDFGYIYVWSHEESTDDYDTIKLVTTSFSKLIQGLKPVE